MITIYSEKADELSEAKSIAASVLESFPPEVEGFLDLERAVSLLGEVTTYLDDADEEAQR